MHCYTVRKNPMSDSEQYTIHTNTLQYCMCVCICSFDLRLLDCCNFEFEILKKIKSGTCILICIELKNEFTLAATTKPFSTKKKKTVQMLLALGTQVVLVRNQKLSFL